MNKKVGSVQLNTLTTKDSGQDSDFSYSVSDINENVKNSISLETAAETNKDRNHMAFLNRKSPLV